MGKVNKGKKDSKGESGGFLSGAFQNVKSAWREVFRFSGRGGDGRSDWSDTMKDRIEACLAGKGGEVSARARAADLARSYLELSSDDKLIFLRLLVDDYGPIEEKIDQAIEELMGTQDPLLVDSKRRALANALKAPRVSLLRKFNTLHSGPRFLVQLREDLLGFLKEHPDLKSLDTDLKELLVSWFDARPVHSALVQGLASQVQALLDEKQPALDADEADTAIFYSISNTQRGLAGISFGNFLIKQVVDRLRREQPNLKHFSTLSPIPGFRKWLDGAIEDQTVALLSKERPKIKALGEEDEPLDVIKGLLSNSRWTKDEETLALLEPILTRWCAQYLQEAKRSETSKALDPVAHFHLTNGARIERINWMGDNSGKGLRESAGMMVNYLYQLDRIDRNHEAYTSTGRVVVSSAVKNLLKKAK